MRDPIIWLVTSFVMLLFTPAFLSQCGKDNSDPPDGRSGLTIYTDALTGCEYLSVMLGGITPRLDGDGRQIGCR